jgi:CHASE2 domain-containing sensor protein
VAAVLLWRRRSWGYVLATVLLVKGLTYPLALVAMSVLGTWDPLTPAYVFFWVLSSVAIGLLLVNMRPAEERSEVASRSGGGMSAVTR